MAHRAAFGRGFGRQLTITRAVDAASAGSDRVVAVALVRSACGAPSGDGDDVGSGGAYAVLIGAGVSLAGLTNGDGGADAAVYGGSYLLTPRR